MSYQLIAEKSFAKDSKISMKKIERPKALDIDEFGRHSSKEKVTLDDLFLLHSTDGGARVDVSWHVAKFFTHRAKGYKTKSLIVGAHLIERIARYNGLGYGELVDDIPDNGEDEGVVDAGDDDEGIGMEQERFQTWNADHLSQLLSYHYINHTRYYGAQYSYVPNIPDLGVQQGVNFMSSTPVYSTAPSQSLSPNPFGFFGDATAGPSTSQNQGSDMNEE
nr:hypothetical protein [Tanacetum cinerariifolium]